MTEVVIGNACRDNLETVMLATAHSTVDNVHIMQNKVTVLMHFFMDVIIPFSFIVVLENLE